MNAPEGDYVAMPLRSFPPVPSDRTLKLNPKSDTGVTIL
jgi:hypothetical protein